MKVFIIDNYDSFTFNLVHIIEDILDQDVVVKRNDCFELSEIEDYSHIVLSPGPGLPSEAGLMPEVVRQYGPSKKILGVCLGHQCIGEVYGAGLENLSKVVHGKGIETLITHRDEQIYKGLPEKIVTGRYHSWVVSNKNLPDCIDVTSVDDQGFIMSLRHKEYDVVGVQYHPESVLTPMGRTILENWLA
jgi:anthranilate synthase component 2